MTINVISIINIVIITNIFIEIIHLSRSYVVAIICPVRDTLEAICARLGKPDLTFEQACLDRSERDKNKKDKKGKKRQKRQKGQKSPK